MERDTWASYFIRQWEMLVEAAQDLGCEQLLHIWADQELKGYVDSSILNYWWYRPTPELWGNEVFNVQLPSNHLHPMSNQHQKPQQIN